MTPIALGDAIPDVPVVTVLGEAARLPEVKCPGPVVLVPFRGPW